MEEKPTVRIIDVNQTLSTKDADFIKKNASQGTLRIFDLFKTASAIESEKVLKSNALQSKILNWLGKARTFKPEQPVPKKDSTVVDGFVEDEYVSTYLSDFDEPYKGFPAGDSVQIIATFKKLAQTIVRIVNTDSKWFKVGLLLLYLSGVLKRLFLIIVDFTHLSIQNYILGYEYYSRISRECYRVSEIIISREPKKYLKELIKKVRDIWCLIMEYDNAYRYRFQDTFSEVDLEALNDNPAKEIKRLFGIMVSREIAKKEWEWPEHQQVKIKRIGNIVYLAVKYNKYLQEIVKTIALNINLDKIKPVKEDIYWFSWRDDYNFGGKSLKERTKWRNKYYKSMDLTKHAKERLPKKISDDTIIVEYFITLLNGEEIVVETKRYGKSDIEKLLETKNKDMKELKGFDKGKALIELGREITKINKLKETMEGGGKRSD